MWFVDRSAPVRRCEGTPAGVLQTERPLAPPRCVWPSLRSVAMMRSLQDRIKRLIGAGGEMAVRLRDVIEPVVQTDQGDGRVAQGGEVARHVAHMRPATVLVITEVPGVV